MLWPKKNLNSVHGGENMLPLCTENRVWSREWQIGVHGGKDKRPLCTENQKKRHPQWMSLKNYCEQLFFLLLLGFLLGLIFFLLILHCINTLGDTLANGFLNLTGLLTDLRIY